MLTVSAKDFGPIVEGKVDLKPLTIFMGRSNTGKSYRFCQNSEREQGSIV